MGEGLDLVFSAGIHSLYIMCISILHAACPVSHVLICIRTTPVFHCPFPDFGLLPLPQPSDYPLGRPHLIRARVR